MEKLLDQIHGIVWGAPSLLLILGVGLYLTVRLEFVQLRLFPQAFRCFWQKLKPGSAADGVSSFQALCTALAATVGTGNLVGVAGAICLGGPGTIFWMWVCGILGMAIKYAEAVLAIRFREKNGREYRGGPMYVMTRGLGKRWYGAACLYCVFGMFAAFGVGNAAQINAVITGINTVLARMGREESLLSNLFLGCILAMVLGMMLFGGAKRIGMAAERLIPFAAVGYILLCVGVLAVRYQALPNAVFRIVRGAFSPKAVTGGMLGSAFLALRVGCSRGVFTNEAGMGTASIAHACASVNHPVEQGFMGIMEVFLDTILICTLTALVILVSGIPIPYGVDAGAELTTLAFAAVYGDNAALLIAAALILFAVATVLGWGLYGVRCAEFLFGIGAWKGFVFFQMAVIVLSSVLDTATVWKASETINGLMAIPNLIMLAVMAPELVRLTKEYKKSGKSVAGGGTYANFYQCKPL